MSKRLVVVMTLVAAARSANAQTRPEGPAPAPSPAVETPEAAPTPTPPPPEPTPYERCREQRRNISEQAQETSDLRERARLLQSMPQCSPAMATEPEVMNERADGTASSSGGSFALEVRLDTTQTFVDDNVTLPATQGGLFMGSRSRSLIIGIGVDLMRISGTRTTGTGMDVSTSLTSLLISPGVRAVLARSSDERTELFGQVDIGYGAQWSSTSEPTTSDAPSTRHLRGQIAPGVRYWISPNFAVGGSAGLRYERFSRSADMTSQSTSATSIFSSLQLTGAF